MFLGSCDVGGNYDDYGGVGDGFDGISASNGHDGNSRDSNDDSNGRDGGNEVVHMVVMRR